MTSPLLDAEESTVLVTPLLNLVAAAAMAEAILEERAELECDLIRFLSHSAEGTA